MIFADQKPYIKHDQRKFDDTFGHPADVAVMYSVAVTQSVVLLQDNTKYVLKPNSEQDKALICACSGSMFGNGNVIKNGDNTVTVFDMKLNG